MRVAGIMSGTSLDGIDVAVVDLSGREFKVVEFASFPYAERLRARLLAVSNAVAHVGEISRLNFELGEQYARAVKRCGVPLDTIDLIGCHGQTIFHEKGNTLQIGCASVMAERLGKAVVSDFRPRDIAAGGRGAPLVPFVDYWLYRDPKLCRVALNIGGIANVTILPPKVKLQEVIAFDTGPGNMVIDQLVDLHTRGKQRYDAGGSLARKGKLQQTLLANLLRRSYYRKAPPKTAGREQYGREFIDELLKTGTPVLDLITTATAFTAATIATALQRFAPERVDELIVSGGGSHNVQLLAYLQAFLPAVKLRTSSEFGVDVDAKEAIAFAILAYETWHRRPSNVPSATGAKWPVILGNITY